MTPARTSARQHLLRKEQRGGDARLSLTGDFVFLTSSPGPGRVATWVESCGVSRHEFALGFILLQEDAGTASKDEESAG